MSSVTSVSSTSTSSSSSMDLVSTSSSISNSLTKQDFISQPIDEIATKILSFLNVEGTCCMASCSRNWNEITNQDYLWTLPNYVLALRFQEYSGVVKECGDLMESEKFLMRASRLDIGSPVTSKQIYLSRYRPLLSALHMINTLKDPGDEDLKKSWQVLTLRSRKPMNVFLLKIFNEDRRHAIKIIEEGQKGGGNFIKIPHFTG